MTNVTELRINRKITALFADGAHMSNLGVPRAASMLSDATADVKVTMVDADDHTRALLRDLAEAAGREVREIEEGFLLARPAAEPTPTAPTEVQVAKPVEYDRTRGGLIVLGPDAIFTSYDDALKLVKSWNGRQTPDLPVRYHQELTRTFVMGKVAGQIFSVFKDLKRFGAEKVKGKLISLRDFSLQSADPVYVEYRNFYAAGLRSTHVATHKNGRVDPDFTKYCLICDMVAEATA